MRQALAFVVLFALLASLNSKGLLAEAVQSAPAVPSELSPAQPTALPRLAANDAIKNATKAAPPSSAVAATSLLGGRAGAQGRFADLGGGAMHVLAAAHGLPRTTQSRRRAATNNFTGVAASSPSSREAIALPPIRPGSLSPPASVAPLEPESAPAPASSVAREPPAVLASVEQQHNEALKHSGHTCATTEQTGCNANCYCYFWQGCYPYFVTKDGGATYRDIGACSLSAIFMAALSFFFVSCCISCVVCIAMSMRATDMAMTMPGRLKYATYDD